GRLRSTEEIARVEFFVPQVLVNTSVECVRTRTRRGIHNTAGGCAISRAVAVRQHGKLLNGIHAECQAKRVTRNAVGVIVLADPIEKIVVLRWASAADAHCRSEAAAGAIGRTSIEIVLS